ncbi:hypothetical protein Lgra_0520 [Legionella gratiana]|uniref:Uncharacterized protein n=1 Tax=Legionella gratiana TaxID=45066 RepID=A0A378J451_9GAMM|nr:hypothetical protein [Legionella gratiana]KTD14489.1 hypothetical protein Lgra_0520 [Legionella gratiana]STX42028.1 Uncharacterised protein [Legionella gratiana]
MSTIALLDVDSTLLFNGSDLNHALLDSLLQKGIKDVYLFTNMGLEDIRYYNQDFAPLSRHAIIQIMRQKGFNVHGVITPADAGNYDNQYQLRPVGTIFNQLYTPLMEQVIKSGKPLDLQYYTSDKELICNYFVNELALKTAERIMSARQENPAGEKIRIKLPQLTLLDVTSSHQKRIYVTKDELMNELNSGKIPRNPYVIDFYEGEQEVEVMGADFPPDTANKALMMEACLQQLASQFPNLSIVYFDDDERQLHACQLAVANYNSTYTTPVHLTTQQVSKNYNTANNSANSYMDAITNALRMDKLNQIIMDKLNRAIKDVAHHYSAALYDQLGAAQFIKSHFNYMNYQQYIELAKVAMKGNTIMFNPGGANSALHCLRIAMLLTKNDSQEKQVIKACLQIMEKYNYHELKKQNVDGNLMEAYSKFMRAVMEINSKQNSKIFRQFEELKNNIGAINPSVHFKQSLAFIGHRNTQNDPSQQESYENNIK